jgi:hypothetical protein
LVKLQTQRSQRAFDFFSPVVTTDVLKILSCLFRAYFRLLKSTSGDGGFTHLQPLGCGFYNGLTAS